MATLPLITDATLKKFIQKVRIDKKDKDFLISKLPEMDFEERRALFETLMKIHILDLEEEKAIARIEEFK